MAKERLPIAGTVISEIRRLIAEEGSRAFECNGHALLYSGPERLIQLALDSIKNHQRATIQALDIKQSPAKLIDYTKVGKRLDNYHSNLNIYDFFKAIYDDRQKALKEADQVMRFASREFAKACYGSIETAVCGADLNNVFFEVELPELVRNKRIKTINNIPMQRIRDIYFTQGAYIAHREICKAELQLLKERENSPCKEEIKQDRKERLQFFRKACKATFKKIKGRDKKALKHLGPNLPHVMTDSPIRTMTPQTPYMARSVQYG